MGVNLFCSVMLLVIVFSTIGCTSLRPYDKRETMSPRIQEEDLANSPGSSASGENRESRPGELIRPRIPGTDQSPVESTAGKRAPRRLIWKNGKGSKPSWEGEDGSRQQPADNPLPPIR